MRAAASRPVGLLSDVDPNWATRLARSAVAAAPGPAQLRSAVAAGCRPGDRVLVSPSARQHAWLDSRDRFAYCRCVVAVLGLWQAAVARTLPG